ncbi:hypothetical protein [Amycolatopsis sp. BJA-103]|uniref:hypothetical protein n=1 Tax=Amycolatopsis sp. BJA-103 TaxID=1911175 RepID=UPI001E2F9CD6|nr:hypothetical protein [Amycolatopsis sp. BJA-103]
MAMQWRAARTGPKPVLDNGERSARRVSGSQHQRDIAVTVGEYFTFVRGAKKDRGKCHAAKDIHDPHGVTALGATRENPCLDWRIDGTARIT